jgi:hypothetical protein
MRRRLAMWAAVATGLLVIAASLAIALVRGS